MVELFASSGDPDQKPHSVASDLGLHCLPNTLLGVSRLQWVKGSIFIKNRHFIIQERFNKLLYGINTIIKCGT